MKVSKSGTSWLLMATVVASLVFANLISLRHFVRVDLTKDGKYTLSKGSQETMRSMRDTMVVTAYFSDGLPAPYASYARYVRDLLEEYRAVSNAKLAFEFIDPASEENEEDKKIKQESSQDIFGRAVREPTSIESELVRLGIQPVEIRVIEDDQQQTKRAYMGLVIRYQGKTEVLPLVQDFAKFETDMTMAMRKLIRKKTPVIALVSDVPDGTIRKFKSLIGQTSELKELDEAELKSIPNDVDALLLVGTGAKLTDDALRAIDAFVASGKNVGFFIDQQVFDPQSLQPISTSGDKPGSKLKDLLASYGVSMGSGLVADAQCASLSMQEHRGDRVVAIPVPYPFMPQVAGLDQESPISRGLSGVIFPFASPVSVGNDLGLKVALLAQSSKKSWLEAEPFKTDPKREWRANEVKESGPFALAVDVRGKLKRMNRNESRMLVIGTSAFAWDPFFGEENQALAMASIDYLVADDAIIGMRSRSIIDLPLDQDLSEEQRSVVKFANILGVPALLIAYGLFRWRRRERRRRSMNLDSI